MPGAVHITRIAYALHLKLHATQANSTRVSHTRIGTFKKSLHVPSQQAAELAAARNAPSRAWSHNTGCLTKAAAACASAAIVYIYPCALLRQLCTANAHG